jgi:hypothetical protein
MPAEVKSGEEMNGLSRIAIWKYEIRMKKKLKILRAQEGGWHGQL